MSEILVDVVGGVATVTLNAPGRRNALTPAMAASLTAAVTELDMEPSVGAVVIHGSGGTFCSGAHLDTLNEASSDPASEGAFRAISDIYDAFVMVGHLKVPTVAAVEGAAVGAGLNLMMATDLRVVARDARLLSGFGRLNVHPGGGHFSLLARSGSREAAAAIGLFGEEVDGERAMSLGLAWEAVDASEVLPRAVDYARRLASDPPLSRRMVALFRMEVGPPAIEWRVAVEAERASQMWSFRRRS